MKKLFTLLILAVLLCGSAAFAENINIYNTGDTPYEIDCDQAASQGGTSIFLYDDGGTGDYQTNQSYTMTLHSNNGGYVALYFQQFNLAEGTFMSIRNEVTGEILVSNATGTELRNRTITAYNGSITIIWNSGATTGDGFMARVYCGYQCQRFATNISVNGIEPATIGGETYYDVYSGGDVQFHAENDFYENGNNGYTQTDANLTYDWAIINSTQDTNHLSGQNPNYTFNENGYYSLICIAKDQQECYNQNFNKINIRSCVEPLWRDTTAVCGNITMVNAGISGYSEFTWHAEESGSTVGTFEDEHSPILAYTAGDYGVVKFYYDANIGGNIVSDTLYIEFFAELTTTAGVDTACGHTAELQVFNANPDYEGRWSAYDLNNNVLPTVIYHDYSDPTSASSDSYPHCYVTVPISDDATETEYIFRWTEGVSDPRIPESCVGPVEKHIIFRKMPVVSVSECGVPGNDRVTICDRSVELCASSSSSDFAYFSWICNDIEGSFADPIDFQTTFTLSPDVQISRYRDVDFLFTATNGDCSSTDTMHVRFIQKPEANAGVDAAVCGRSYNLHGEWSFPPSDDYTPTGQWIVGESPNGATVNWATAPATETQEDITVTHYGIYTFIFREMNNWGDAASCYDRDTVTVEFMEQPSVYAGENFPVCGTDFELNAISSHVEGDSIRGQWICLSASGDIFDDPYNPHTTGHYSASESAVSATFRWIETNHPHIEVDAQETCAGQSDITVTFYPQPSARINMGPGDTAVCGLEYEFLRAELPGDGITGMWYEESSLTMFGPQNAAITSPTAPASVTSYGRHEYYWILYALIEGQDPSFCTDTAGPWHIDFIEQPSAQITETEFTYCGYFGQLSQLNVANSIGNGRWSTNALSSVVSFNDASDPNTLATTTVLNSENGADPYYTFYWNVSNTQYCTDKDSVRIVFAANPSDEFSVIPPKCFGEPAIITATDQTLPTYTWEYPGAFGDDTVSNTNGGNYRMFVHWDKDNMLANGDSVHNVTLVTTNEWGCSSAMGSLNISEPRLLEYTPTIMDDVCGAGTGYVQFVDTTIHFYWIDSTGSHAVTATDSFRVSNLREGEYSYRTVYQTFNTNYRAQYFQYFGNESCIDTLTVEVGTIGMIEAGFAVSADALEAPANVTFFNYTNFDNVDDHICEWHFGDGATESNCEEFVEHIYTAPGCYEPYLVVSIGTIPECRDTAWLNDCVFVDRCTVWEDKDTTVNNYIQLGGHTFYTDGVYQLEIETDDTCRHILRLYYTIRNGVDEYDSDDIRIFPNPTNDILHISSPVPISRVEIFSIDGRNIGIFETSESDVEYDVSKFVEGVYFARIYGTDGRMCSVKKFTKE